MSGILYVTGTPIGNLEDITLRQLRILEEVDFIAAEDTRVTRKLLTHFDLKTPLVSYHDHSGAAAAQAIADRIEAGENCAIVTDAGMPCISDPGEDLVRLCAENSIPIEVVPGPSALISALAVSGLDTSRFSFEGFPSVTKRSRFERLAACAKDDRTLIFYEAPHKLISTLADLYKFFGERKITLCRELRKVHEEIIRTTLSEAQTLYDESHQPRGEYVLVVEGAREAAEEEATPESALEQVKALVAKGMRGADACREIAKTTGISKSELYSLLLESNND